MGCCISREDVADCLSTDSRACDEAKRELREINLYMGPGRKHKLEGLWRSGSAFALHAKGLGFDPQLLQFSFKLRNAFLVFDCFLFCSGNKSLLLTASSSH